MAGSATHPRGPDARESGPLRVAAAREHGACNGIVRPAAERIPLPSHLDRLCSAPFDLLVVGGGIHGAFAAWDAALRGLRVALVDRGDFGAEASSNSLRILHGGFRYLRTGDISRLRASSREQRILWRMAPHLVRVLPCVVPERPGLASGRLALRLALEAHALLRDRRDPDHRDGALPPAGRTLDGREFAVLAGTLAPHDARGGALWHDAELTSPERFLIAVVRSAEYEGATAANHVQVTALRHERGRVTGARVRSDEGSEGVVQARLVLLAAGAAARELAPWGERLPGFATAVNVVMRADVPRTAVAIPVPGHSRLLFAVPWGRYLAIGTAQRPVGADDASGTDEAGASLLASLRRACPALEAREDDVTLVQRGLLPGTAERLLDRALIVDHAQRDGVEGVVTLLGVKWTTARRDAERAVDACMRRLAARGGSGPTAHRVLAGSPDDAAPPPVPGKADLADTAARDDLESRLAARYGGLRHEVLALARRDRSLARAIVGTTTIAAEVVHAIRAEHALHLDDIVLRRTALGVVEHPGDLALHEAATLAAAELGWTSSRMRDETARVTARYARGGA